MTLANYPLLLILSASLVAILGASEIGRRYGLRNRNRGRQNISTLEGSILGLLALMIGFTFAMALSGFEARRNAVMYEANAIGTTALRARLLLAPHNQDSVNLLREYVQVRLDLTQHVLKSKESAAAILRSRALQEALWQQVKATAAQDNAMVPTGLYIQALNAMFDRQEERHAMLLNRVPNMVLIALYGLAIVASAFAGYAAGLDSQRSRLPIYTIGVLVAVVIFLIQDIDKPGPGLITVSQQPMIDTAAFIAGFPD
ncbi:MAG: hypothetical protein Q8M24_07530 [Pseudolabrys sp.]|nr:hypothetical protein [Pseudolabrys sp.]MDP2295301.1 hypothetical protein [Pseudolabrys sp.]